MKTDKNSRTHSTTSGTSSHPELTVSDTNPQKNPRKYQVHLYWTHTEEAFVTIEADSLAEAEEKAYEIVSEDLPEEVFSCCDGYADMTVDSVSLIEEGQSDE